MHEQDSDHCGGCNTGIKLTGCWARVVVTKIVPWLRFWLNQSPFFTRFLEWILSPIFHNTLNAGLPSFWCLQDGGRSTRKENRLNMCSKQDFIPIPALVVKLAMILKAVGNLFQTLHLHVDSLIWFRYQVIVHVWTKNCSLSFTEWPICQNLAGNHIFLSRRILPAASA